MPFTFGQLKSETRAIVFPAGEASNLIAAHDKFFVDALVDLQGKVQCLQVDNTSLYPQCSTLYKCGLTVFDAPRGIIRRVSVVDRESSLSSGAITASKVGNVITASAPFFTNSMVGNIIRFGDGEGFRIWAVIDSQRIWTSPAGILSPEAAPIPGVGPYLYLSAKFRVNQTTGWPEEFNDDDGEWHALRTVGEAGDVQFGPDQTGTP